MTKNPALEYWSKNNKKWLEVGMDKSIAQARSTWPGYKFRIKGGKMFDNFKQYITKHQDMLFTIALVLVLDHFIFAGAFRDKLKTTIDGLLERTNGTAKQ